MGQGSGLAAQRRLALRLRAAGRDDRLGAVPGDLVRPGGRASQGLGLGLQPPGARALGPAGRRRYAQRSGHDGGRLRDGPPPVGSVSGGAARGAAGHVPDAVAGGGLWRRRARRRRGGRPDGRGQPLPLLPVLMGTRTLQAALSIALLVWMAVPAAAAAAKAAARGLPEGFLARVLSTPAERAAAFDELMTVGRLQELASVPKNLVQAYVFGTIDTPAVIGGLDGWLFYREQFRDSACPPDPVPYVTAANSVATAQALAELVGVHLVWAMAPDKSVVHPEKLGPRVVAEAPCRLATATLFRETLRRLAPQVVDHLEALSRGPDGPQDCWATDTHWSRVGYLRAMWQLRQALDGTTGALEIVADEAASEVRTTDLPRLAVGRNATEAGPAAPTEVEKLVLGTPIGGTQGAVVVHDSFLGVYTESATLFGPEAVVVNVNRLDVEELPSVIDGLPGLILLSTAERQAVRRMTGDWAI